MRHCLGPWIALGLAAVAGCGGGPAEPPPPDDALYELDLREVPPEDTRAGLFGSGRPNLRELVEDVARLAEDDGCKGLLVRLGPLQGAWGVRYDLAQALSLVREAGKPVHCHLTDADNVGYALAAESCDRISMSPAGTLNLVGPALQVVHARELLQSLGVEAELLQIGEYKGAAEPFTRDDMSEPLRQSLGKVLDDLDTALADALEDRTSQAGDPVEHGPFSSREALEAGLIDGRDYDDAARAKAKTAAGAKNFQRLHEPPAPKSLDLGTLWDALTASASEQGPQGARLGYVVLSGEIADGSVPSFDTIVADPTVEALRDFADDDDVKAVVIRIDSPGGSALASDRIWHAVRRIAGRKPVAVSVGDMAASGGYYIASAASRIFAAPASLVGSIGVVGGKVSVQELATDNGVHTTTLTRGPYAGWLSPLTPFSEAERDRLEALLEGTYQLFLHRVSVGRGMKARKLHGYAQGRLMTARRALEGQLVDEVASLHAALAWAREQGGLADDAPVETWPGKAEAMAALRAMFGGAHASLTPDQLRARLLKYTSRRIVPSWVRTVATGRHVATSLPVQLELR